MIKQLYTALCIVLCSATLMAAKQEHSMTREQREVGASAVDSLALMLPGVQRSVIDDAYQALEKEVDPKLYEKLEILNKRAAELKKDIEEALAVGKEDDDPVLKTLRREQKKVKKQLNELLYNGGALHWRSILALGMGACIAFAAYRRAHTLPGGVWGAVKWGLGSTAALEVMMRGKYAYFTGKIWWLIRQVFHGIRKLVGADSLGEDGLDWVQDQMHTTSDKVEKVMGNGRGIWISLAAVAVTAGIIAKCVPNRRARG